MKKFTKFFAMLICCAMFFTACKKDSNQNDSSKNAPAPQISMDIDTNSNPVRKMLAAFQNEKFTALGVFYNILDKSEISKNSTSYTRFQANYINPVYDANVYLDDAMLGLVWLEEDGQNKWKLKHDNYSGNMEFKDGAYKALFTVQPEDGIIADPDEDNAIVYEDYGEHILIDMDEQGNKLSVNIKSGKQDDEESATVFWCEILKTDQNEYWTQYYYTQQSKDENIGLLQYVVREHISGQNITYTISESGTIPKSILDGVDETSFFATYDIKTESNEENVKIYETDDLVFPAKK